MHADHNRLVVTLHRLVEQTLQLESKARAHKLPEPVELRRELLVKGVSLCERRERGISRPLAASERRSRPWC